MKYFVYIRRWNEFGGYHTTKLHNNNKGYTIDEALKECERFNTYGYDTWYDEVDA